MVDIRHCYDILDVPIEASTDAISRQHRDLVNIWHPDRFVGNPRLQKKAEQKLAAINAAYDTLIDFLQSGHAAPSTNAQTRQHKDAETDNYNRSSATDDPAESERPYMSKKQWAETKPKRTWLWRLFYLFSISLVVSSLFIIPKIRKWYPILDNPAEYLKHTIKSAAYEVLGEVTQTSRPQTELPKVNNPTKTRKQPLIKQLFEIRLVDGNVIVAKSCRIKDDMLVYQLDHGSIGIQRSRVKSIKVIKVASK